MFDSLLGGADEAYAWYLIGAAVLAFLVAQWGAWDHRDGE